MINQNLLSNECKTLFIIQFIHYFNVQNMLSVLFKIYRYGYRYPGGYPLIPFIRKNI